MQFSDLDTIAAIVLLAADVEHIIDAGLTGLSSKAGDRMPISSVVDYMISPRRTKTTTVQSYRILEFLEMGAQVFE